MPRWVKTFAAVAAVLLLLFSIVLMTGLGGPHGPGRHLKADFSAESVNQ